MVRCMRSAVGLCCVFVASVLGDITIYVGGTSASATNGGCGDSSLSVSQVVGANGAPVDSGTGASVTNNGSGYVRITLAGGFTNSTVGSWVYVDFVSTSYTDGRSEITAVDPAGNYVDIGKGHLGDTTATFAVGGAVSESELENIFDGVGYPTNPVSQTEQVFVKWYDEGDGYTRASTWVIDTGSGGPAYGRYLIGCDASYNELPKGQRVRLISGTSGYLLQCVGAVGGQHFRHIQFDGANTSSNVVSVSSIRNSFYDCEFTNGTQYGAYIGGPYNTCASCEAHDNGSDGFNLGSGGSVQIVGCKSYNNGGNGVQGGGANLVISKSLSYGNTGRGFYFYTSDYPGSLVNSTAYNNGSDGFYLDSDYYHVTVVNCTAVANGGYGFNLKGGSVYVDSRGLFGWNHADSNVSGRTNLSGTWTALGCGYNVTGSPLFVDPASGDFRPQAGSPLINAGMDGTTIGAREPVYTSGGSSGGLLSPIVVGN